MEEGSVLEGWRMLLLGRGLVSLRGWAVVVVVVIVVGTCRLLLSRRQLRAGSCLRRNVRVSRVGQLVNGHPAWMDGWARIVFVVAQGSLCARSYEGSWALVHQWPVLVDGCVSCSWIPNALILRE
jgi:hypothetical protein